MKFARALISAVVCICFISHVHSKGQFPFNLVNTRTRNLLKSRKLALYLKANSTNSSQSSNATKATYLEASDPLCQDGNSNKTRPNISGPCGCKANCSVNTDARGSLGAHNVTVSISPWQVKSCDQVVMVQGYILNDYDDCSNRTDAFFTLSMYMVNHFNSSNVTTFRHSMLLENIKTMPTYLPASKKSCIGFQDSVTWWNRFAMCVDSQEQADAILKAYGDLLKCRMGDNLKPYSLPQIEKILEASCNGAPVDAMDLRGFNQTMKMKLMMDKRRALWAGRVNPYYNLRIPGSRRLLRR